MNGLNKYNVDFSNKSGERLNLCETKHFTSTKLAFLSFHGSSL